MRLTSLFISSAFLAGLLAGCGGGGGSPGVTSGTSGGSGPAPLTTTAPAGLTLKHGEAQSFTISGGSAPYVAVTNNSGIAAAAVSGNTLTIGAVGPGSATISVLDSKNVSLGVGVSVVVPDLATTAPSAVTLAVGAGSAQTYAISGGVPPYTATSSNTSVAAVSQQTGTTFTITGLTSGTATILLRDSLGKTINVAATVSPPLALFTTAPNSLALNIGDAGTFTISGGAAPYTISSSNPAAVSVSQPTSTTFTVRAAAAGAGTVTVRDSVGATSSTSVTVTALTMSLNPAEATSLIGLTNYAYIIGGKPPYTAISTFGGAAAVDVGTLSSTGDFTANASGNVLRMVPNIAADPNQIVVTDSMGNRASFALKSSPGQPTFTFAPESLLISDCLTGPITLSLYGGTAPIRTFSSDTSLITVTSATSGLVTLNKAAVSGVSGSVTITALDATGKMATAVIGIVAPAAACP